MTKPTHTCEIHPKDYSVYKGIQILISDKPNCRAGKMSSVEGQLAENCCTPMEMQKDDRQKRTNRKLVGRVKKSR